MGKLSETTKPAREEKDFWLERDQVINVQA